MNNFMKWLNRKIKTFFSEKVSIRYSYDYVCEAKAVQREYMRFFAKNRDKYILHACKTYGFHGDNVYIKFSCMSDDIEMPDYAEIERLALERLVS